MRGQHTVDGPGLAAILGHEPAQLAGDPRGRQHPHRPLEQPGACSALHLQRAPEGQAEQHQHGKAQADHDAEGPEHRRHPRHGAVHRFADHLGRGLANIGGVLAQQQTETEVCLVLLEHGLGLRVVLVAAQGLQRHHGMDAAFDALAVLLLDLPDARDLLVDRARADQAHDPGNLDLPVVLRLGLIDASDQLQAGGRGLGLPHRFERGHLGLLRFAHGVARLVTEHDHTAHTGQAEGRRHAEASLGELGVAPLEQVPAADRQYEHRTGHVAGRDGVHELGLCIRVEQHRPEVDHFHAHGFVAELGTHRVLHPAIGDQDPQCAQVGAHRHQDGHHQVLRLRQPVPAEEEQADHGRLQEEGHQALDRQRRPEDVAHVVRVVGPVGAKLKLQRDAGRHAQCEIDAEELAPEAGHVLPDDVACHHIDAFHDDQQPDHAQRQRHEQEVVHRRRRKLQAREIDQLIGYHVITPGWC